MPVEVGAGALVTVGDALAAAVAVAGVLAAVVAATAFVGVALGVALGVAAAVPRSETLKVRENLAPRPTSSLYSTVIVF